MSTRSISRREGLGKRSAWVAACVTALVLSFSGAATAQQLVLGVVKGNTNGNNYFTVNGQFKFLVFVSYFDALDVPGDQFIYDLQQLKARGVDGIRIFPNWWTAPNGTEPQLQVYRSTPASWAGDTLIKPDGTTRYETVLNLNWYLDRAREAGMIVELAMSAETVSSDGIGGGPSSLNIGQLRAGLRQFVTQLRDRGDRHILLDIQNEGNLNGPCNNHAPIFDSVKNEYVTCREDSQYNQQMTNQDLNGIVAELKQIYPELVITMSTDQNYSNPNGAEATKILAESKNFDVAAWHDFRDVINWYNRYPEYMDKLGKGTKPVYFSEPIPYEEMSDDANGNDKPSQWRRGLQGAIGSGAAAWCFHTKASFRMNTHGLYGLGTQAYPGKLRPLERIFLDQVNDIRAMTPSPLGPTGSGSPVYSPVGYWISMRTYNNLHWVTAENGGGSTVVANRTGASYWEVFLMTDRDGETLRTGDAVTFLTWDRAHYLRAVNGGGPGSALQATAVADAPGTTFYIYKLDAPLGTPITFYDWVFLRTENPYWVAAEQGGGGAVNANRTTPWLWERFYLYLWP